MNLNERELATVLAALRHWQAHDWKNEQQFLGHFEDGIDPLDADEIDDLCEQLNVVPEKWYCVTGRRLYDDEDTALNCRAKDEDDAIAQLKGAVLEDDDDDDQFVLIYIFSSESEIKLERPLA